VIEETGNCPPETQQGVAGNERLVKDGKPYNQTVQETTRDRPYARTAVGLDKTGQKLWIVIVDGKQFRYSEGLTIAELAQFMLQLGADSALNLDGGGSATLVAETPAGAKVLNAPIHTRIPLRERPVAVHLGFFAK
jgi:exopolysaccharide biosynthesis protein